jgi:hypothetical protein
VGLDKYESVLIYLPKYNINHNHIKWPPLYQLLISWLRMIDIFSMLLTYYFLEFLCGLHITLFQSSLSKFITSNLSTFDFRGTSVESLVFPKMSWQKKWEVRTVTIQTWRQKFNAFLSIQYFWQLEIQLLTSSVLISKVILHFIDIFQNQWLFKEELSWSI